VKIIPLPLVAKAIMCVNVQLSVEHFEEAIIDSLIYDILVPC